MFIFPGSRSGGYQVQRSLRFRASASAYLSRTPGTAANQTTWTWSGWIKRGQLGVNQQLLFAANAGANYYFYARFTASDTLEVFDYNAGGAGSYLWQLLTTQVFRDPSAWYHIVIAVDTTQATAANRVKLYVNGVQITSFSAASYPSLSFATQYNFNGVHNICAYNSASAFLDTYAAEINSIGGLQLTPSSFGQFDPLTGQWVAKKYTGTYGTNGFYLDFSDPTSTTTLCTDRSGNGNNWTSTGISVTAGVTYDSMLDVPSGNGWADGGNGRGNYATLNPVDKGSQITMSESNLKISTASTTAYQNIRATIGVSSGKWYWEATGGACNLGIGLISTPIETNTALGNTADGWAYSSNGNKNNNGVAVAYGATFTTTDVLGVALDIDGGTLTFYKNGVSQGVAYSGLSANTYFPMFGPFNTGVQQNWQANFGQRPFAYTPPTGFKALHAGNLPAPTIQQPNKHFDVVTQLGSSVSTGAALLSQFTNFTADFAWGKDRAAVNNHQLVDTVRGSTAVLQSNTTAAETTYTAPTSGDACVAWGWKAGGTAVTNNAGTISSQVSANTSAGFSIVTYIGTGANATVGHGLGVAPKMVMVFNRAPSGAWDHYLYHSVLSATDVIALNTTAARVSLAAAWNNTAPTSTTFSLGTNVGVNENTKGHVAYCFTEISGFSKIASYTGNGSADGPFVYCGFRPKYVLVLRADAVSGQGRYIWDTVRTTKNVMGDQLWTNLASAEAAGGSDLDFLSNGFKLRGSYADYNASGGTYIFAAFAEFPFNYSNAR